MRHAQATVVLVVFVAVLLGSLPAGANDYFPLTPGLHHKYVEGESPAPDWTRTVIGEETFRGRSVWAIEVNTPYVPSPVTEFYSVEPNGDVLYHGSRSVPPGGGLQETLCVPAPRIIAGPIAAGTTWNDEWDLQVFRNGNQIGTITGYVRTGEIIAIDSPVTVPAGEFMAAHVETSGVDPQGGSTLRTDTWYASGVGQVRSELFADGAQYRSLSLWGAPVPGSPVSWTRLKAAF